MPQAPYINVLKAIAPTTRSVVRDGIASARNFFFPIPESTKTPDSSGVMIWGKDDTKDLRRYVAPIPVERKRTDIKIWRESLSEAESRIWPFRYKMQRMFMDTRLNGHVMACMQKRKDLSLLREWNFQNDKGEVNEEMNKLFDKPWFSLFLEYAIEARFYGYQLIVLGDLNTTTMEFPKLGIVQRTNISPDRLNVTAFNYSVVGEKFLEGEIADWHCWVPTPSDLGISDCGYGELYPVAQYEITHRNMWGQNADAAELFGQPIIHAKTDKTGEERETMETQLFNRGSAATIVTDVTDQIAVLANSGGEAGFNIFPNYEERTFKIISKMLLGHADAIDSKPGKLGNDKAESPAQVALDDKQTNDGAFLEDVVKNVLLPKCAKHGFKVDPAYSFKFDNNAEKEEIEEKKNKSRNAAATFVYQMFQAGWTFTAESLKKMFPDDDIELIPLPTPIPKKSEPLPQETINRIANLYKHKH